ncbi:MAG: polysaccharide deacetylase family protein [Armatimonadetes bacterium]|nr:polysaccharide deacetylase family protein [Armatimonadota bacterium]MDE2206704.1 polysaccharide deacetylase family protein [Armatimonadota bacterium]
MSVGSTLAQTPSQDALKAVQLLIAGRSAQAESLTQRALLAAPAEPTFRLLAAADELLSGDTASAMADFQGVTAARPHDALAWYGLGICQIALHSNAGAVTSFAHALAAGGDKTAIETARAYLAWLNGANPPIGAAPGGPALLAVQAMEQATARHIAAAEASMSAALDQYPGLGLQEPAAPLMTFDRASPIEAPVLPMERPLGVARAGTSVSGTVRLQPDQPPSETAYVTYQIDGSSAGLVNVSPFDYEWDTTTVPNGPHKVVIVVEDAQGTEILSTSRTIQVLNARRLTAGSRDTAALAGARAGIWKLLTPMPSCCVCSWRLGAWQLTSGDRRAAGAQFLRSLALRPDYAPARKAMRAIGIAAEGMADVWGGLPTPKLVALTFDDGPKPGLTEPLLATLVREHVPATFFVIGRHVVENLALTRLIAADGMELANHTFTHPDLTTLSPMRARQELLRTQAAVALDTGQIPQYMRPPGGDWNDRIDSLVRGEGLTPTFWTVDAFEYESISSRAVADAVLKRVRPGSILLLHNGKLSTVEALPRIVSGLRARGYRFVTIAELSRRLQSASPSARALATRAAITNSRRAE